MPSGFVRHAAAELIRKAESLGVEVPDEVRRIVYCGKLNGGAVLYANAHPDPGDPTVPDELLGCCYGAANGDLADCTCWEPVFALPQQPPQLPVVVEQLRARPSLCGDCAFRKGSPERATVYEEEALFALAERGDPFWCHDGMRRPLMWLHPAGPTVPGDPADWQPPMVDRVPFRADGTPGLLCAGWASRAARAKERP